MSSKKSTGLCDKLLKPAGQSFADIFNLGFIKIYSGAAPATADAAETGTLICTLSNASGGTGLTWEAVPVLGVLSKKTTEVWSGVNASSATVTHYRLIAAGDTGVLSTTQARLQGLIGTGGAVDMVLQNVAFVNGATFTLPTYTESITPG